MFYVEPGWYHDPTDKGGGVPDRLTEEEGKCRVTGGPGGSLPVPFQGMGGLSFVTPGAHRGLLGAKPQGQQAPLGLLAAPQSQWSQRGPHLTLVQCASSEGTGGWGYRPAGFGLGLLRVDGRPGPLGTDKSELSPQECDLFKAQAPSQWTEEGRSLCREQRPGQAGWTGMGRSLLTVDPWTQGHVLAASTHVKVQWLEGGGHKPHDVASSTGHRLQLQASQSRHPLRKASRLPDPRSPSLGTETHRPGLLPWKAGAGMFFNVDTEILN